MLRIVGSEFTLYATPLSAIAKTEIKKLHKNAITLILPALGFLFR